MKIAMFHELDPGGALYAADCFAQELTRLGHTVDLFTVVSSKAPVEKQGYSHTHLFEFNPVQWSGNNWRTRLYRDSIELYHLRRLHGRIAGQIDAGHYDVAIVHPSKFTQSPFLLSALQSTPTLYYCQEPLRIVYDPAHGIPQNISVIKTVYERLSRFLRKIIDKQNIRRADRVLANSHYTQQNILSAYNIHSYVSHIGVDTTTFHPGKEKKNVDIFYLGTKSKEDGYFLLQEALQYIKNKPTIRYRIRGEPWLSKEKLRSLYARSMIVLCLTKHEPFGLIALEAMASGAVVIALKEGGYLDSIADGKTGVLVEDEPRKLAKAIESVLGNSIKQKKLRHNAQRSMKLDWNWSRATHDLLNHTKMVCRKVSN